MRWEELFVCITARTQARAGILKRCDSVLQESTNHSTAESQPSSLSHVQWLRFSAAVLRFHVPLFRGVRPSCLQQLDLSCLCLDSPVEILQRLALERAQGPTADLLADQPWVELVVYLVRVCRG